MTSVLVTGASGFIGSKVVARLADAGEVTDVVALDMRQVPESDRLDGVTYAIGDIRDPAIADLLVAHGIDTVVHLAAVVTPGPGSTRELEYSIDVEGTRNVLDACIGAGVRQLAYTSSGAAYGYHADNPVPLREDDELRGNPEFAYSDHKRLVEEMLARERREHPELAQLVFRPGTILGEGVDNQITAIFERPVVTGVRGSDSPFVIIWADDVADAIVEGIREHRHGIFNLAGDGTITLPEIARRLRKPYVAIPAGLLATGLRIAGRLGVTRLGPEQVRFLAHRPVLSNERLKAEFGFVPSRSSSECFDDYISARTVRPAAPSPPGGRNLRVVVTGGAGGLGAALARRYRSLGARVAILDRDEVAPGVGEAGADGLAIRCDVTDPDACAAAIEKVVECFGGIDVLVNNAGLTQVGRVGDTDLDVYRKVMDVNFFGAVNCTSAALPQLLGNRGRVVTISSVAGFAPLHGRSGYSASKHALHGFFDTLRSEYEAEGLGVTIACPSFIDTGIGDHALGAHGEPAGADARSGVKHPMSADEAAARIVDAANVGKRIVFVSREARLSWWVSRLAPRLYEKLMLRRTASS